LTTGGSFFANHFKPLAVSTLIQIFVYQIMLPELLCLCGLSGLFFLSCGGGGECLDRNLNLFLGDELV